MTSANLWDWQLESILHLSSNRVIDACVYRLPNGRWRMWYKDEANQSHTYAADSDDLYTWTVAGPVITGFPHEGPNVFVYEGYYWMIIDPWKGLGVYRSDDCESWTSQASILDTPGQRQDDAAKGQHADVLVNGENAWIFYFTHPEATDAKFSMDEVVPYAYRRTSLQVAQLKVNAGRLTCDRDEPFEFILIPPEEAA
jgi:hypothetical protein